MAETTIFKIEIIGFKPFRFNNIRFINFFFENSQNVLINKFSYFSKLCIHILGTY